MQATLMRGSPFACERSSASILRLPSPQDSIPAPARRPRMTDPENDPEDGAYVEITTKAGTRHAGYYDAARSDSEWFYFERAGDLRLCRVQRSGIDAAEMTARRPVARGKLYAPFSHPSGDAAGQMRRPYTRRN